jgi:pimeloyl-ACP methyl ester carboxylesterase
MRATPRPVAVDMDMSIRAPSWHDPPMPIIEVNDIEICYESFGPDEAPALLLVMGLGAQMTLWSPGFMSQLLERGFRVIRFDNRDVGLSSKTAGDPPDVMALYAKSLAGEAIEAPYTLSAMANDAVGLLDALGIQAAHIVGASMGGMIVQMMAIEHPNRVLSMTSIMSTTGASDVGQPDTTAIGALLAPPPTDRDAAIASTVNMSRIIAGSLFDEAEARAIASEGYDRCFHPAGPAFQIAAIAATGDRTERLGEVRVPTLVVHGREDSLVTLSGGEATAAAVPGADLLVFGRMGHDMPREYWSRLADAISGLALAADDG